MLNPLAPFELSPLSSGLFSPSTPLISIPRILDYSVSWPLQSPSLHFGIAQSFTPFEINPMVLGLLNPLALLSLIPWPLLRATLCFGDCRFHGPIQSIAFGITQSFTPLELSPLFLGLLNPLAPSCSIPWVLGLLNPLTLKFNLLAPFELSLLSLGSLNYFIPLDWGLLNILAPFISIPSFWDYSIP